MTDTGHSERFTGSSRYAWYATILLTLTQIVSYLDRFLPSLLIHPIEQSLKIDDFQMGLLLGPAFVVFYAILGLPLGWLADRFSRRIIVAVGVAIWCAMTTAGAFVSGFVPLLATRLGVGIGEAAVPPASISLIGDFFHRNWHARAISLFMAGTFLGAGTSFLFFGPVVQVIESLPPLHLPLVGPLASWRLCFVLVGAPGLILSLFLLALREPKRRDITTLGDNSGKTAAHYRPRFRDCIDYMMHHWRAFGTLFIASTCNVMMGTLSFWNVDLFRRTWHWDVADVGIAVGLILFTAGPIGTLLGVFFTNRDISAGRMDATLRALFLGLLIGVPAYAAFPMMPNVIYALVLLFIAQLGQAMATAAGPATLVRLAPGRYRGQSTAIYYLVIGLIAQFVGPPLVGLITEILGSPATLRYAISIEAGLVGVPSMLLMLKGFAAYRRSVSALDSEITELQTV